MKFKKLAVASAIALASVGSFAVACIGSRCVVSAAVYATSGERSATRSNVLQCLAGTWQQVFDISGDLDFTKLTSCDVTATVLR